MTNALDRFASTAPVSQITAVEQARAVAEVAAAVQVAQMNPRNMDRAWAEMEIACGRSGLASRAFYAVPNRGNGPSVHLARELARIWGNLDYGVRELRRDDLAGESEIQAFAWDQQTNVRSTRSFIVPHARMAGKTRKALTDLGDIYLNNQNAGARAVRECVFAMLPADFVDHAKDLCSATLAAGTPEELAEKIDKAVAAFARRDIALDQLERKLGRKRPTWSGQDFAQLDVLFASLKRNEITKEEAFPAERVTADEITRATPPARNPMDQDLHLHDDQQAMRLLAAFGQMHVPGEATSRLITEFCGFETPDGLCNLPKGHPTGPELDGYDGHDVIPAVATDA